MDRISEIKNAAEELGLGNTMTKRQLDRVYRRRLKEQHPDRCPGAEKRNAEGATRRIVAAYRVLSRYIENYRYAITDKAVRHQLSVEDRYALQFEEDAVWGNGITYPQ